MNTTVEVRSVEKSYGFSQVISHCTFEICEGEIYGLLGINGAGKTTLMKMILGLQKTDRGSICVLGREAGNIAGKMQPFFLLILSAGELFLV